MLRQRLQRLVQHVRQLLEVGAVVRRIWTDEPRLLPKLLRQPMEGPHGDAFELTDGDGQVLGQRPIETGEQHVKALGGQSSCLFGREQRLARASDAQDEGAALRRQEVERAELRGRERDARLVGGDVGGEQGASCLTYSGDGGMDTR